MVADVTTKEKTGFVLKNVEIKVEQNCRSETSKTFISPQVSGADEQTERTKIDHV